MRITKKKKTQGRVEELVAMDHSLIKSNYDDVDDVLKSLLTLTQVPVRSV